MKLAGEGLTAAVTGGAEKENVTLRKSEEDSDEDPTVPPPLHGTLLTLTRDT